MGPAEVAEIITAYGAVLAEPTTIGVRDLRLLPYSKDDIKAALRLAFSVTDDAGMRDALKAGYISLADFQQLTEREARSLQLWNSALAEADLEKATENLAAESEVVNAIHNRIAAEATSLALELKVAGL